MKIKTLNFLNFLIVAPAMSVLPASLSSCSTNAKITVTLDPDGGQISQTTIQVNKSTPYSSSLFPTPTKPDYVFKEWVFTSGNTIPSTYIFEKNVTLKASYQLDLQTVIVTLNPDGGSIGRTSYEIKKGSYFYDAAEKWNEPYKHGSKFLGWTFEDGSEVPLDYKINENTTFKALYQ